MQLDGFLRSASTYAAGAYDSTSVLWKATSAAHHEAYRELRDERPDVQWVEELDFVKDFERCIHEAELTVFHTDDDVFFRPFAQPSLEEDEVCFTLRLGLNTTYCYPLDAPDGVHGESVDGDRVRWRWREQQQGAYCYPLAVNGHAFRTPEVRDWLGRIEFESPNTLEVQLQTLNDSVQPMMASYRHSCVVSIPANLVNTTIPNRHGGLHDVVELNERYLRGERLNLNAMDFSAVDACHMEIPFVFARM